MSDILSVTVIPDGPLKLSNVESAEYCGQALKTDGDLYICRCGDSANAPFCDGSHSKNGFDGTSQDPPEQQLVQWEGQSIRTTFNKATCMHAGYCKPLKELRAKEEVGDAAAAEEIMKVVASCPSGALTYETKADQEWPTSRNRAAVDIIEGGEVRLQAEFEINAPLNQAQPDDRATLCRCGMSKNKPWCDARHKGRKGFR